MLQAGRQSRPEVMPVTYQKPRLASPDCFCRDLCRALLVGEDGELVENSEPSAVLVVDLEETSDLSVRLRSPNYKERELDLILVEVAFAFVVKTMTLILVRVYEPQSLAGYHRQNGTGVIQSSGTQSNNSTLNFLELILSATSNRSISGRKQYNLAD